MDDKTDFSVEIAKHEYQLEKTEQKIKNLIHLNGHKCFLNNKAPPGAILRI